MRPRPDGSLRALAAALLAVVPQDATPDEPADLPLHADRLEYVGVAVHEPGYHVWGSSPIEGADGRVHLFVARWPVAARFDPGWRTHSEIARYVGEGPEGPFVFAEVVLRGTGEDTWDRAGVHNPAVHRVGERFALLYIGNDGLERHPANQRIGMCVAPTLEGPWAKVGEDGLLLAPPEDPEAWNHEAPNGVNNPALLRHPDGRFLLYFKSTEARMGLAIADALEGPYRQLAHAITHNDRRIEDGYAFAWRGRFFLVTTDNHGILTEGGGLLWESPDGVTFDEPPRLAFDLPETYLEGGVPQGARRIYGPRTKFERPQVLLRDGAPTHLYLPSGTSFSGGAETDSHVLRIRGAPGEGWAPGR